MKEPRQLIFRWIQRHILALLIGVAISLIVVSPHLRAWSIIGPENFEGVYPVFHDDEITYQARIKEVLEGNFNIGNPYINEHKDDPFIMPPIAEALTAGVVFITNTSVPFVTSASDFVLVFLSFLLVYALFLFLTKGYTGVSLLYTLLFFVFSLTTFGRPISPQVNALFLFLGIITITRAYFAVTESSRKTNLIAGLVAGITCFISPYYFTALLAFYGVLMMVEMLWLRDVDVFKKKIIWFLLAFIPFASFYAFFHLSAGGQPFYGETMLRYGLIHTHIPGSFTNIVIGVFSVLVIIGAMITGVRNRIELVYPISAAFTIFVLNWQNIITGTSLQFTSHYRLTTILLALMVIATIIAAQSTHSVIYERAWKKTVMILGVGSLLLVIAFFQRNEFLTFGNMPYSRGELLALQEKRVVFDWFNINTPEDSVVYTLGGQYDFFLPVYTKNRVYYNFYAALYPASDTETEERWLRQQLFVSNMSTTTIRDRQREFWGNQYLDSYQSIENRKKIIALLTRSEYVPSQRIPTDRVEDMFTRWEELAAGVPESTLAKYQIDYILLSEDYQDYAFAIARLAAMDSVTLVTTIGKNRIYQFERD